LDDDDQIRVTAPFGLDDLFGMVIRHNPARCSAATFQERLASKKFVDRWPQVSIKGDT
jgi:uncharacterized protein